MDKLLVLKLGGSLITHKDRAYCMRHGVMRAVSHGIRACMDKGLIDRLLLVHGVGSYGHPPVIKHELYKEFLGLDQLMPISWSQRRWGIYSMR